MELDRNHIVSAGYIRNWTVDDVVECELVPSRRRLRLAPTQVGVRTKFYAGSPKADGTRTAEAAEKARGDVETRALPLLRDLADRWPLRDGRDRAWVSLWVAMTLCGSPSLRREIPSNVGRFFSTLERERPFFAAVTAGKRGELSEPDFELDSMFAEVSTVASLIGQMHWTLLTFGRPAVISSDHPITSALWTRKAEVTVGSPSTLLVGSFEVRLPVGPRSALLFTWFDGDDRVAAARAAPHHLSVLNQGVWEQAERHRFWQPGMRPRGINDRRPVASIAAELCRGYDPRRSERLSVALEWHRRRQLGQLLGGIDDRAVVITWMEQTDCGLRIVPERHDDTHAEAFSHFVL